MILFRTSNIKKRKSLTFLTNAQQLSAINRQLQMKDWIDEIFSRTIPIPNRYQSRFGPPDYNRIPFYSSEKRETTFYEYGFSLIKQRSIIGLGISAVCFEIIFQGKHKPIDASIAPNSSQILHLSDYSAAHQFLLSLTPPPETIRYPSVRDPNGGGINFVIFEKSAIQTSNAAPEEFVFTPQINGTVDIESLITGQRPTITPIQ